MSAVDNISRIINNRNLASYPFKYCLVDKNKIPYTIEGKRARPNQIDDFSLLEDVIMADIDLSLYNGVGISIQGSNISAIDVDKCFSKEFDITSGDKRANEIIEIFKNVAYIEFSFSGKGLRILFTTDNISNYSDMFYIKNEKTGCEFYQSSMNARYVTLTGFTIYNNPIVPEKPITNELFEFLTIYMTRPKIVREEPKTSENDDYPIDVLLKKVKLHYVTNAHFQDLYFKKAPGHGSDESETDFSILMYMYNNITQNKEKLKILFESTPYFKSKDWAHVKKWKNQDFRYYNYIYERIRNS